MRLKDAVKRLFHEFRIDSEKRNFGVCEILYMSHRSIAAERVIVRLDSSCRVIAERFWKCPAEFLLARPRVPR